MTTPMIREPNERAIEAAADAIGEHEYRVDHNTWVPSCTCGWTADAAYDIPAYDRHVAADALEAALPRIRAAMPHLRRTIPNSVEAVEALPDGAVIRGVNLANWGRVMVADRCDGCWYPYGLEHVTDALVATADTYGITEWTVLWEGDDE